MFAIIQPITQLSFWLHHPNFHALLHFLGHVSIFALTLPIYWPRLRPNVRGHGHEGRYQSYNTWYVGHHSLSSWGFGKHWLFLYYLLQTIVGIWTGPTMKPLKWMASKWDQIQVTSYSQHLVPTWLISYLRLNIFRRLASFYQVPLQSGPLKMWHPILDTYIYDGLKRREPGELQPGFISPSLVSSCCCR